MKLQDALNIFGLGNQASQEEIKSKYKALSKQYHPDINKAGLEMMKIVNAAYDELKNYDGSPVKDFVSEINYGEKLNAALNAIITLNLNIEVCGSWVWVTGDTRANKDTLKMAGYKYAKKKQAWYFRPEEYKSFNRGSWNIDKIRNHYGSAKIKEQKNNQVVLA